MRVIGVSVDPPEVSRALAERSKLPIPILSDEKLELTREFGLLHVGGGPDRSDIPIPAHVLIGPDGRVRWKYVADRVQNRLSPERVLDRVRTVLADKTYYREQ